ncbi:MAG: DUF4097 family beta strand repeat-containing protein [Tannerella sp.]|jgi:hypothetical protein|nr:DUF4097 family beta strand repeat-containing protein [Tannerella sp.]
MKTFITAIMLGAALSAGAGDRIPAAGTGAETGIFTNEEYKREVTREFTVGAAPDLLIENKYGNIRIIEGTENKIMFRIEITGKGRNSQRAREYAESVHIRFAQDGNSVSAVTELESLSCNNCGRTIHYTVVAPKSVAMNLTNKYGHIILDDAAKPIRVTLKYGNLTARTLDDAAIDLKYGNADVGSCRKALINSKYSKLKIGRAETLEIDSKYDGINVGTVSAFDLNTKYTNVTIDRLNERFVATGFDYGKLDISEISTGFNRIKIEAKYSTVKLALDSRHSFKAVLYTKYGDIDAGRLTFNNVSLKKGSAIVGNVGADPNPSATVDIDVSYGDIKFK